jgi:hypothetical protein
MTGLLTGSSATRRAAVAVAVILGLVIGVVCGTLVSAGGPDTGSALAATSSVVHWPENANGLTYGSALDATCPEDEPDLIQVVATNGKEGYVLRTDLEDAADASVETPQAALSEQAARKGQSQAIPAYESDGTTEIGVFEITPGQASRTRGPSE